MRYRFRVDAERGRPLITLRGPSAQVLSQYEVRSGAALPQHERDFVYGLGQLLVERKPVADPRTLTPDAPLAGSGDFGLSVGAGAPAGPYTVDVRTVAGFANVVSGITPDALGRFRILESALAPGCSTIPSVAQVRARTRIRSPSRGLLRFLTLDASGSVPRCRIRPHLLRQSTS